MPHRNNRSNTYFLLFQQVGRPGQLLLFLFLLIFKRMTVSDVFMTNQVCNDTLSIAEDIHIPIICDNTMKKRYLDSNKQYQEDLLQLHTVISSMIDQPYMYCKMAKITANNKLKIQLRDAMPHNENMRAAYERKDRVLMIKAKHLSRRYIKRALHHEFHHAFVYVRNEILNINLLASFPDGSAYPLGKDTTKEILEQDFGMPATISYSVNPFGKEATAKAQVENFHNILLKAREEIELKIQRVMDLLNTRQDKVVSKEMHDFFNITAQYEPFEIQIELQLEIMNLWINANNGIRNDIECCELNSNPTPEKRHGVNVYFNKSFDLGPSRGILYGYTVRSFAPLGRSKAALLDAKYLFNLIEHEYFIKDNKRNIIAMLYEMDAHLHERYEPFPEIFQYLFRPLVEYHKEMDEPLLGECLENFPEEKKIHPFLFFNASTSATNEERRYTVRVEL